MAILSDDLLKQIQREAQDIEYGSITIKLNGMSNHIDIGVTKDVRVLKDKAELSEPGRVVVRSVTRQG